MTPAEALVDAARWAPSGDNAQNWRFDIVDSHTVRVHGHDTRDTVVYDFDGRPSQIALGALLETAAIAASRWQLQAACRRVDADQDDTDSRHPVYDITLSPAPGGAVDPLAGAIEQRRVQRRALSTRAPSAAHRRALEAALGPQFTVRWFTGWRERARVTGLLWRNAKLRLTMPEAFPTHCAAIEWGARFSVDRIPDQAVGMDRLGLVLMRWAMHSWARVHWMNRFMAGTWLPRLQLDVVPGMACGAHFVLVAAAPPRAVDDYVAAGRALQRFWLTATTLGLQLQPEMTPLIFNWYVQAGRQCSAQPAIEGGMRTLRARLRDLLGAATLARACFMGRIGYGEPAGARSLRLSAAQLAHPGSGRDATPRH